MATNRRKSRGAELIEAREVTSHKVNLAEYLPGLRNHDGEPMLATVVVVNRLKRQKTAFAAAYDDIETSSKSSKLAAEAFKADSDITYNAKMIQTLFAAFRDPDDDKYPLFFTPDWMEEQLTATELGALVNIYVECEKAQPGLRWPEIDRNQVEAMLVLSRSHDADQLPTLALSGYDREWLTEFVLTSCIQWGDERREAMGLLREALDEDKDGDNWRRHVQSFLEDRNGGD